MVFAVKESIVKVKKKSEDVDITSAATRADNNYGTAEQNDYQILDNSSPNHPGCCAKAAKRLPRLEDVLAGFKTVFRPRAGIFRALLLPTVFNYACYIFAYNGTEGTHRYLYATKKYGWSEQEYTRYLSLYRIFYMVALWVVVPGISKYLRFHDAVVAIIAVTLGMRC